MDSGTHDDFPSLKHASEYMVPGPGMGALQPWIAEQPTTTEQADEVESADPASDPGADSASIQADWQEDTTDVKTDERTSWHEDYEMDPPGADAEPESVDWSSKKWAEGMPPFLRDEIVPMLASAQHAAAQIVERAREQAHAETVELDGARALLEERMAQLVAWQEQVEPIAREFQQRIEEIRVRIDELPDLIRKGLDPLAATVTSLDPTLAQMTGASKQLLDFDWLPKSAEENGQPSD